MSQRFSLFYAGYTAAAPAYYYNQLSFISEHENSDEVHVRNCLTSLGKLIEDISLEHSGYLKTAVGLAESFKITIPPMPASHTDYFDWFKKYVDAFETKFPMSRIDFYYFFYGRKLAEIYSNVCMAKTLLDLSGTSEGPVDFSKKIDGCLKDSQFILFKLIAAAALLSSEPRLNFFNVFYKQISTDFEIFKNVDLSVLSKDQIGQLAANLETYRTTVMDGFKKCIGLLKEVGL